MAPARVRPLPTWILLAGVGAAAGACGAESVPPAAEAVFEITACRGAQTSPAGERFRVLVRDASVIGALEARLGRGPGRIVSGTLRAGDGGFNAPWSWHLDPATVELVEVAIELCDGCPSFVEGDLAAWLAVGRYCPWSSEVTARVR
jgi:hypothetical protein